MVGNEGALSGMLFHGFQALLQVRDLIGAVGPGAALLGMAQQGVDQ